MKNSNPKLDPHVAIFAFPFGTHAAPLLNMTRKLASNAPNIIFSFFNTSKSNTLVFSRPKTDQIQENKHKKLGNLRVYDVWDGVPPGYEFKGNHEEEIELFMVAAPAALRAAVVEAEAEAGRPVSCMVGDAFLWFVAEMAQEKGVPWVASWPGPQHDLSVHFHSHLIRETIGVQGSKDQVLDFIPGMSKIRVEDLPQGIVMGNQESFFSQMLHKVGRVITHATAICINSCEELHPTITHDLKTKLPPKVLCVGPYNLMFPSSSSTPSLDESNCLVWLDQQEANSVAYVSFGSVARPSPSEIFALAQGLEASRVKFLWSLKDNLKVHLPDGFVENNREKGKIVPWAPQTDVLAHEAVGVFITHFGYNSIIESIAAQVPMIGRPLIGEQKLNGRFVEAVWGIGVEVEGGVFTKDGVVKSLNRVLWEEESMKLKENIKVFKAVIDKALGPQGSCNHNFLTLLDTVSSNSS